MDIDAKFIMSLWTVARIRKVVSEPRHAKIIEAQTNAFRGALAAAMNGEAIVKIAPPTAAYDYYRAKWIATGDTRYLDLMVRNFHGDA